MTRCQTRVLYIYIYRYIYIYIYIYSGGEREKRDITQITAIYTMISYGFSKQNSTRIPAEEVKINHGWREDEYGDDQS